MTRLLARPSSTLLLPLIALAALCLLGGCGGGGNGGGVVPPPVGDTATVRGTVVQADGVNSGISGATVMAVPPGTAVATAQTTILAQTTTGPGGDFVLRNIPVGDVTIVAQTPNEADYGSQSVPSIHLNRDDDVALTISVLPSGAATPAIIYLSPTSARIDLFGQIDFEGSVATSTGSLDVTPSYYLTGGIGVVDRTGHFTATAVGTGKLWAVSGNARTSANIEVTGPRGPQITSYFVSPRELTAGGGKVNVTVAANDGDGITQVRAEVYMPDGSITNVIMERDDRTLETYWLPLTGDGQGNIGRWLVIPANSNTPDKTGHQEPQRYSIRVIVTDSGGASSQTDFVFVTVAGIEGPPPF